MITCTVSHGENQKMTEVWLLEMCKKCLFLLKNVEKD